MDVKKSLALAVAVSSSSGQALAADWSGVYGGITGGGGWGSQAQHGGILTLPSRGGKKATPGGGVTSSGVSTITISSSSVVSSSVSSDGNYRTSGGLVGGAVGYNWQMDKFVFGLAASESWGDISGSGTCGIGSAAPHSCGGGVRSLGTAGGRIGYDIDLGGHPFGPFSGLLIFASGGLAVGDVHAWDSFLGNSGSKTLTGYAVGGGLEAMFLEHWSIGFEYLHIDLGEHAFFSAIPPTPERVQTQADVLRLGVSYHFGWPGFKTSQ